MQTPARSRAEQIDSTSPGWTPRKMATRGHRSSKALSSNAASCRLRPGRVQLHPRLDARFAAAGLDRLGVETAQMRSADQVNTGPAWHVRAYLVPDHQAR